MRSSNQRAPTAKRAPRRSSADVVSQLQQAEILLSISQKVAAAQTLDEALDTVVQFTTLATGAERGTLFLNDARTGELYARVALGYLKLEIRMLNTTGLAGFVYTSGEGLICHDAYADDRFSSHVDEQTEFVTKNVLCAPVKTVNGEIIGVIQTLNKTEGQFTEDDLALLEAMATQAAGALQSNQIVERMEKSRTQELEFFDVVSEVSSEIQLGTLLQKIMAEVSRMLNTERSTLFLNDEKTNELWSEVGSGLDAKPIRFPNHMGIAGAVFTSGESVNIPHAYADLRFNPAVDRETGYFTRSMLCVPVVNKYGKTIGVTQVLNKRGSAFTEDDESRLRAFTAQVSIALENAKLFDEVQKIRHYNESMLESMSNGVITVDEDGKIITCNAAGLRIMQVAPADILERQAKEFFVGASSWVPEKVERVAEMQASELTMDAEMEFDGQKLSVNLTVLPLISAEKNRLGSMIMIEDITSEKRVKSTMARYMDPSIVDQLLESGEELLGGKSVTATVLFSDVRGFTTLTEELGAQGTVSLLNDYFTIMVDCIQRESGMLDKFIGDAIMAVFGLPIAHEDDEDRAVRTAVAMMTELRAWNGERAAHGQRPVDIGIGLNTDVVVSGNIGSPKRMDYTMIGDGVNLAARLESACKQYAACILISENTYKKLRGTYRSREVDLVIVKGKTEPVGVYEIVDYHTDETFPNVMGVMNCFKSGLAQYRKGEWDDAIAAFEEALNLNPDDTLSQIYIERCRHMKENPPGDDWNGVWIMTRK